MKLKLVKSKLILYARLLAAWITAGLLSVAAMAEADEARPGAKDAKSVGISLMPVTSQVLPDDPTRTLTAFMVYLTPGASTTSHRHAGTVFVHVLEGTVRSQLNNGEVIEYGAGESWNEPPGSHPFIHGKSQQDHSGPLDRDHYRSHWGEADDLRSGSLRKFAARTLTKLIKLRYVSVFACTGAGSLAAFVRFLLAAYGSRDDVNFPVK